MLYSAQRRPLLVLYRFDSSAMMNLTTKIGCYIARCYFHVLSWYSMKYGLYSKKCYILGILYSSRCYIAWYIYRDMLMMLYQYSMCYIPWYIAWYTAPLIFNQWFQSVYNQFGCYIARCYIAHAISTYYIA